MTNHSTKMKLSVQLHRLLFIMVLDAYFSKGFKSLTIVIIIRAAIFSSVPYTESTTALSDNYMY